MDKRKYLIITPTYNETANIMPLTEAVMSLGLKAHILFVDDNSQDGTRGKILRMQKKYHGLIHLISRPAKLGLGSAYVEGFCWGLQKSYDYFIEMDADLSHNPTYLKEFINFLPGHDVVCGSRYVDGGGTENWSMLRRLISQGGSWYARSILGVSIRDLTGGYNLWHRRVLEAINPRSLRSDGYVFQIELKYRALLAGFSLKESPIIFCDRRAGQSKMSFNIVLEAVYKVFFLRFSRNRFRDSRSTASN